MPCVVQDTAVVQRCAIYYDRSRTSNLLRITLLLLLLTNASHIFHITPLFHIEVLHLVAQSRRFLQAPTYYSKTKFSLTNLWDVDLTQVDVVAVYGLHPIMKELGVKLQHELRPGSIVLSNVFSIPGWKPSKMSRHGMHIYITPECWTKIHEKQMPTKTP